MKTKIIDLKRMNRGHKIGKLNVLFEYDEVVWLSGIFTWKLLNQASKSKATGGAHIAETTRKPWCGMSVCHTGAWFQSHLPC